MRSRLAAPALLSALVALAPLACGPAEAPADERAVRADGVTSWNGLTTNGLANNGLANNGLASNGLASDALAAYGLIGSFGTASFATWFLEDPVAAEALVRYVVRCALPAGASIGWKNRLTGRSYTWTGELGFAPSWATSRKAPPLAEQRAVTACLAALANRYGLTVPVSIQGRTAPGPAIPLAPDELVGYPVQEGCFFGNVFDGSGVFVGLDHPPWDAQTTSARACALDVHTTGTNPACPPIVQIGFCRSHCRPDPAGPFYATCTWDGVEYPAVTTRLREAEVYRCGDGVCQFTEACGPGNGLDACNADCGACP